MPIDSRRETQHIHQHVMHYCWRMGRPKLALEDPFSSEVQERFWSQVRKTSRCWLWTAGDNNHGYGVFYIRGGTMTAHKYSFVLHHGLLPVGHEVRHTCDVRRCVRPSHLLSGTRSDNMQDAVRRHRHKEPNSIKTHCVRGHPLTGGNLYRDPNGGRHCKTCRRVTWRQWNARRHAD